MKSAEAILLPIQTAQQDHDVLAHQDILNLDTHTRVKHMTLHFLKYAGKIAAASENSDRESLAATIVDSFIICLATANTLNVSLGADMPERATDLDSLARIFVGSEPTSNVFVTALFGLVKISGRMAKAIESTDHLERGNPRAELESLIVELCKVTLATAATIGVSLESSIRGRWKAVEAKSIFRKTAAF